MDPTSGLGVYAKQLGVSVVLGPTWRFMGNYKSGYKWGIYIYIYLFIYNPYKGTFYNPTYDYP